MQISDLIYLGQQLTRAGQLALSTAAPGMQTAESMVMAELLEQRFSTITEMAQRTGYAQSRISTAVASLKRRGLVNTRTDPADGRRTVVYVADDAPAGAQSLRSQSADTVLGTLLGGLADKRRAAVMAALEELHHHLRPEVIGSSSEERRGAASEATMDRWAKDLGVTREKLEKMTPLELARAAERRASARGSVLSLDLLGQKRGTGRLQAEGAAAHEPAG